MNGDGTESNPYLIETETDLRGMSMAIFRVPVYFELTSDIHLSPEPFLPIDIFKGEFNGNGHSIYGIQAKNQSQMYYGGFIRRQGKDGTVRNLNLRDCNVYNHAGQHYSTGGIVGTNWGSIFHCSVQGDVTGTHQIGGIAGENDFGTIIDCHFEGSILGLHRVGGIAGFSESIIERCSVTGSVINDGPNEFYGDVGGIVGLLGSSGYVIDCYREGHTEGFIHVGRIVGRNNGTIRNCYASGTVKGHEWVGLVAGRNYGSIMDCPSDYQVLGY